MSPEVAHHLLYGGMKRIKQHNQSGVQQDDFKIYHGIFSQGGFLNV